MPEDPNLCESSPDKKHRPDLTNLVFAFLGTDDKDETTLVFDIDCVCCGRSGSFPLGYDEIVKNINW